MVQAVQDDGNGAGDLAGGLDGFIALSAGLTGFSGDELHALGVAREYLAVVLQQIGPVRYGRLAAVPDSPEQGLQEAAKAVIHLWYTGCWPGIPGESGPFVPSAEAYAAGLVWRAVGGRAPGTYPAGFGSWGEAPAGAVDRVGVGR
ncbi:hypothetical protein Slala03_21130 [Streptomyces lavendulae subsp. lavendulae]|uniref:hypothetical protein n=1 Tax=Streptomyces lavendulae TaxID=1914 RepID=UPI0024A2041A|nr:hypothetical protein [Streptomyces lavendulae]GLV82424.1 hypothetical protein Slala03_21130 [Streptomyces lavendulae subsp. lavendulae]